MNLMLGAAAALAGLIVFGLVTALVLVATPEPPISEAKDVFNFASLRNAPTEINPPSLQRYAARDGEELVYRVYELTAQRILIFIHGSTYHGGGYHALAAALSHGGAAKVVLPNLRGHFQSGRRRGDIDYIGQLEDDLDDLIKFLRSTEHLSGPITLGGHSSGGGLTIRFAGGAHARDVSSYLPMAPIIPLSNAIRGRDAGGWASMHWKRLYGLLALNAIGIHGFTVCRSSNSTNRHSLDGPNAVVFLPAQRLLSSRFRYQTTSRARTTWSWSAPTTRRSTRRAARLCRRRAMAQMKSCRTSITSA